MAQYPGSPSAGVKYEQGGFWDGEEFEEFLQFTPYGDGYESFKDVQLGGEGVFADEGFGEALEQRDGEVLGVGEEVLGADELLDEAELVSSIASSTPLKASSDDLAVDITDLVGWDGFGTLFDRLAPSPPPMSTANYAPLPHILAEEPEPPPPTTTQTKYPAYSGHFATSAAAKAYRRRSRLPPKSQAQDVQRVKQFGREYWVRRIYNAMIDVRDITDGKQSIHRQRFAVTAGFDALDLEATAHHIFDEAIAVHERGWNRPTLYHKKVVRGKLTDLSESSVEKRLSRICLCLRQRKSSVDDAVRGGVTLALLCDNPEARSFTKASNDAGNKKRGERLKVTSTKGKAKNTPQEQQQDEVKVDLSEHFEDQGSSS